MADPMTMALAAVLEASFDGLVGNLLVMAGKAGRARLSRRALDSPDAALGKAERTLTGLRETELADLQPQEWEAAVSAVHDSFEEVFPIDLDKVGVAVAVDAGRLREHVARTAEHVLRAARLSTAGENAYQRLLTLGCAHIVDRARHVHELEPLFRRDTLRRLDELSANDRRMIDLLRRLLQDDTKTLEFERRYLQQVRRVLGGFELFGVSRGRVPKRQSFERSYVPLAVARTGFDRDDELSGAGIGAKVLADSHRVLLRGGAGAGKSTFLRWMIARSEQDQSAVHDPWHELIPFFVPLRQFADQRFPRPSEMAGITAGVLGDEMPAGWAAEQFRNGRALVLVDGIDELLQEHREAAREWLADLVDAYPGARYYVTTRPSAVPEDWLAGIGFDSYDLLQMSRDGVRRYLSSWHAAAREDHAGDPEMQQWLTTCEEELAATVEAREDLRRLASSPLLCGLLCALHREHGMHLPRDRTRLYDEALDLLLRRWDEHRGLVRESDQWLAAEERTVLLQRLAYSFVRNHELLVPRPQAVDRLQHSLTGMRLRTNPEGLLQYLLERTGVLREPNPYHVQFVHRIFRDYLAARELVSAGDIGLLLANAHRDDWLDVVIMSVALARPQERARILQGLLDGNDEARNDPRIADRLRLLAVACLDQASVVEPVTVRESVRAAASRLIPPESSQAAELLARAGSFVLGLLPGPSALSDRNAANVVRTAALIGGPEAVRKIGEFTSVRESLVIDELLRAWRYAADPEEYARTVLADVDFGDRRVDMGNWKRIRYVGHLRKLRVIRCLGSVNALEALVAAPSLRHLELMQNEVLRDLRPLRERPTLRALILTQCTALQDLSPLRYTGITELSLHFVPADLSSLRGAQLRKLSIRDPRLDDGLYSLPDLPLIELSLDNRPERRMLDGIQRWRTLRRVTLHGMPSPEETELLRSLPELNELGLLPPATDEEARRLRQALPWVDVRIIGSDGP